MVFGQGLKEVYIGGESGDLIKINNQNNIDGYQQLSLIVVVIHPR